MNIITANDLKSQGISILESVLENQDEAIISVNGRPRYVVMDIAHYEQFRQADFHSVWEEARHALVEEHLTRLHKELVVNSL
ncbi:MAG: type II toxin-antitoxin system prevent-host-death family antitoxin [Methylococcaceae bacterium]|nr:type II toxin-antitoxin system prevent-host-death family antitoxin [Methylococcaceae bacterium]